MRAFATWRGMRAFPLQLFRGWLNGIATVAPDLAERVWSAIKEVGYVPNTQARALVSGRSRILDLWSRRSPILFSQNSSRSLTNNLAVEQGYEVFIGSPTTTPPAPSRSSAGMLAGAG